MSRSLLSRAFPTLTAYLLLAFAATTGSTQGRQYLEPGELYQTPTPAREVLRQRLEDAPWKLGRLRIQPRLAIGDLQYVDNVFDSNDEDGGATSDLRASALAGLDAYLPIGDDAVFSAFVHPSYNWWRDTDELRRFNLSYGAALFGLFNRLSSQVVLRRTETERPVNNESQVPTVVRTDYLGFEGALDIAGPWQIFTSVGLQESAFPEQSLFEESTPGLGNLEREEEILSFGLAYDVPDRFQLGLGWRTVDTRFLEDPNGRSNRGSYPFIRASLPGNQLRLDLEVAQRELDFEGEQAAPPLEELTGTARLGWDLGHRTAASIFTARDVVYSAVDSSAYFTSARRGAALTWGKGRELTITLFAESGTDEFESVDGGGASRRDDFTDYGMNFTVPVRERLVLLIGVSRVDIDSTLDAFDRSRTVVRTSVRLNLPEFPF